MYSVTSWIKKVLRLPGNIWNPDEKVETQELYGHEDLCPQEEETLNPSRMGVLIDYLSRLVISGDFRRSFITLEDAFSILKNSKKTEEVFFWKRYGIDMERKFRDACERDVKWEKLVFEDDDLIGFCVELSVFDTFYRSERIIYPDSKWVDDNTIHNIRVMVRRVVDFLREKEGVIIGDSITTFTTQISEGDWDFVSKKEIIDIKVVKNNSVRREYWIQVLVYFLLGRESEDSRFRHIENLTIFNPRLNRVYTIKIRDVPEEAIEYIKAQWGEKIELTNRELTEEEIEEGWY